MEWVAHGFERERVLSFRIIFRLGQVLSHLINPILRLLDDRVPLQPEMSLHDFLKNGFYDLKESTLCESR